MDNSIETTCDKCGKILRTNQTTCIKCSRNPSQETKTGRVWLALGVFFFLLSGVILAATFWFVENRRANKVVNTSSFTPISNITSSNTQPTLRLTKLSSQELLNLVPVSVLSRYRSKTGDPLPDQTIIIEQDTEQYLVLFGSELTDNDNREPIISMFKLEAQTLSDVSREALPFIDGKLGDKNTEIKLIDKGPEFDLKMPFKDNLFENCLTCEQAYNIQEVNWCETNYQLGSKYLSNDPYTIFYLVAESLSKKSIAPEHRSYIDPSLDLMIILGLEKYSGKVWSVENLTTNNRFKIKSLDKVTYSLSNSVRALNITISKQENGLWKATAITVYDPDAPTELPTESPTETE